mgnify:CR=1 FL=1
MNEDGSNANSRVESTGSTGPISDLIPEHIPREDRADRRLVRPSLDHNRQLAEAAEAWLMRSPSAETRRGYARDLAFFFRFHGVPAGSWIWLTTVRPVQVAAWRDYLLTAGYSNAAIGRKLSVLRSLFSYLRSYGYTGANPADPAYVSSPPIPKDGRTVGLTPHDCRRLLDAPSGVTPEGIRDRAIFAVLAYTGCRVGELCRIRISDFKQTSGHRVLEIRGKGGKERRVPLHAEAVERIETWIDVAGLRGADAVPLFRPTATARGQGIDGFLDRPITRRSVQYLVARYVKKLELDSNVTVHSFRVTALTTARERGADIVDLQDFAGHSDPRTTLTYIRNRDRLSRSPAYVLRY